MRLQRQSDGKIITLDSASSLGRGGEAQVYAVPGESGLAAKVYHKPTDDYARKLAVMLANKPEGSTGQGLHIAWPVDLLYTMDDKRRVAGFLMPRVMGTRPVIDFYNPKTRREKCPLFNYSYLHRTARNLAAAVRALHARGYVIGDVNESNILVTETALVTLIDTDSFQVRDVESGAVYRCPVGKAAFTPHELQGQRFAQVDRTPEHDLFGLAVLIFHLLMEGTHPFAGSFQGQGEPPLFEERILSGHFPYGAGRSVPYRPAKLAPSFESLHPTLRQLFVRCFEDGHRNPRVRPDAQTWWNALNEAEESLATCPINNQHRYSNHLKTCPWCERAAKLSGRDSFPSKQAVERGEHLPPTASVRRPSATWTPPPVRTTTSAPPRPVRTTTPASLPRPVAAPPRNWWAVAVIVCVLLGIGLVMALVVLLPRTPTEGGDSNVSKVTPSVTVDSNVMSDSNFVRVPAGEFMMGSKISSYSDERPVHRVRISRAFEMGKCEVTQAQWEAVIGNNPSRFKGPDRPVENVSWDDVQEFINKLNRQGGKYQYRLPTEAEWEYACRAGSTGDYAGTLDAMAWYSANSGDQTHPVGQKQPNKWGLYDMHGNVWEWCEDQWHSNYDGAPADGSAWVGISAGAYRVGRGSSWDFVAVVCRSAFRFYGAPGDRDDGLGFRLVRR